MSNETPEILGLKPRVGAEIDKRGYELDSKKIEEVNMLVGTAALAAGEIVRNLEAMEANLDQNSSIAAGNLQKARGSVGRLKDYLDELERIYKRVVEAAPKPAEDDLAA